MRFALLLCVASSLLFAQAYHAGDTSDFQDEARRRSERSVLKDIESREKERTTFGHFDNVDGELDEETDDIRKRPFGDSIQEGVFPGVPEPRTRAQVMTSAGISKGDESLHELIKAAYDSAINEFGVVQYTNNRAETVLTVQGLREWALAVLNPTYAVLTDEELAVFDNEFDKFLARQGFVAHYAKDADPMTISDAQRSVQRRPVSRQFIHSWATVSFLKDTIPIMKALRKKATMEQSKRVREEMKSARGTKDTGYSVPDKVSSEPGSIDAAYVMDAKANFKQSLGDLYDMASVYTAIETIVDIKDSIQAPLETVEEENPADFQDTSGDFADEAAFQ